MSTLTAAPSVTITIPWPRYPTTTPGGKPSTARNAGKPIPWLSTNVVNNLPRGVYGQLKALWREAARSAAEGVAPVVGQQWIGVALRKRTANAMDPLACVEGAKHLVDGLIAAGVLEDDGERFILGASGVARKATDGQLEVRLTLTPR